ncbi:hypothetical protein BCR36DRAFT_587862 [Piromyces finnis]|uniref:histone acetyltransferase n=1 Tax=Piromyces finnis TaxID=1754191 RepID=A0A1Y1UVL1_9FUNG|nr:hypothetical protein BCR36DRAFT_587862 [Piromyces finnis]|eukprot:ORX41653.1 hypothetical protein BCR36DRAFT_587862 [Piromyces finnis]
MSNILILAASKNNTDKESEKDKETLFNAGMLCNEYVNVNEKKIVLYISKIDTSGWEVLERQPLSLIRAIILGYLSYYQNLYKNSGFSVTLHLYTRAKPNYLFPTSDDANNMNKHILSDTELINWWIKTLSHYPKVFIPEKGFWYCPTGERIGQIQTIKKEDNIENLKSQLKTDSSVCPWTWGYPFEKTALALDSIPQFPDDPKNSLIHSEKRASLINEKTTVRELFEYLAIENFSGNVSACIILEILSSHQKEKEKINNSNVYLSNKEFNSLMDIILSLNYALEEDSISSSKTLHNHLKKLSKNNKILYFNYELKKDLENKTSNDAFISNGTVNNLTGCIKRKNVNDIQGLIKKKKTSSQQASETNHGINNLQGLIKRKNPSQEQNNNNNTNINNIQGLIKRKSKK